MSAADLVGQVLVLLGAAVFVVAALGLRRLQDPYMRISAVATAGGLGVACLTVGAVLLDPSVASAAKVAVAVVLQLLTSAVGGIAIARAAVGSGHRFAPGTDTRALDAPDAPDAEE
ncbi:monovalent cation/H(+) antiporter subunit G [Cellulomonas sp. B6]|uniref:cation:proton antiporter n=1 Tax=Cellulomonas sp. B6 TaxID=1295626 RepID=UPI00073CD509|nr:monovalent cation/H(+) antiporter subunit G [Cellulomonas sp. B6]KSW30296.1 hypothetical protein ATM99_03935 [Cellulomonas sp. B6]